MLFLKKCIKPLGFIIGGILILTLFTTLLSFFNIIGGKLVEIIKVIIPVVSTLLGGFLIGKRSVEKGWIEGLKLALIFIVILMLFDFLGLGHKFKLFDFIYYLILTATTVLGSMLGINMNGNKK